MRIHQVINSHSLQAGGAERLARRLHTAFIAEGFDATLVELVRSDDPPIAAISLNASKPYSLYAFFKLAGYFHRSVVSGDIIHAHLSPSLIYCAILKFFSFRQFRLVTTEHNTHNNRRNTLKGKVIDSIIYRQTEKIICISDGATDSLKKWMPSTGSKATTVYNGIPLHFDAYTQRPESQNIQLLSLGRLTKQKNYLIILQALAWLRDQPKLRPIFEQLHYTIAGEGILRKEIESSIADLGLTSQVTLLGHVPQVTPLIEAADIFLIPSLWEGFGLAAVEAMNGSLPVIASDVEGLREIISGEPDCGILVDPQNIASIGSAIARLAASPELRAKMGHDAFLRSQYFNETKMISRYLDNYKSLSL